MAVVGTLTAGGDEEGAKKKRGPEKLRDVSTFSTFSQAYNPYVREGFMSNVRFLK